MVKKLLILVIFLFFINSIFALGTPETYFQFNEDEGIFFKDKFSNTKGSILESQWSYHCIFGSCINFNVDSFSKLDSDISQNFDEPFTIMLWLKTNELPNGQGNGKIISKKESFSLHFAGDTLIFNTYDKNSNLNPSLRYSNFPEGEWVHIAITYGNNKKNLYINGELIAQENLESINSNSFEIEFGGVWTNYFRGFIDEVKFYDKVLLRNDILEEIKFDQPKKELNAKSFYYSTSGKSFQALTASQIISVRNSPIDSYSPSFIGVTNYEIPTISSLDNQINLIKESDKNFMPRIYFSWIQKCSRSYNCAHPRFERSNNIKGLDLWDETGLLRDFYTAFDNSLYVSKEIDAGGIVIDPENYLYDDCYDIGHIASLHKKTESEIKLRAMAIGKRLADRIDLIYPDSDIWFLYTNLRSHHRNGNELDDSLLKYFVIGMLEQAKNEDYSFRLIDGSEDFVWYPHIGVADLDWKLANQENQLGNYLREYPNLRLGAAIVLWKDFSDIPLDDNYYNYAMDMKREGFRFVNQNVEDFIFTLNHLYEHREYVWFYQGSRIPNSFDDYNEVSAHEYRKVIANAANKKYSPPSCVIKGNCDCTSGDVQSCGNTQSNVGVCNIGSQICNENNVWSICQGEISSSEEICDNLDNDCDGLVDEDDVCVTPVCFSGDTRVCGNTQSNVGVCNIGSQICNENSVWSICQGEISSSEEVCDNLDNDCDGLVDEDDVCVTPVCVTDMDCNDGNKYTTDICLALENRCEYVNLLPDISNFDPDLTSNFSKVKNISEMQNLKLGSKNKGIVEFKNHILNLKGLKLNDAIRIGEKYIKVDSIKFPILNLSATLTFFNITEVNPIIYRDNSICEDCNVLNFTNNTLVFNVSHWSTYRVEAGNYCGDFVCDFNENCSSCSLDCGICEGESSSLNGEVSINSGGKSSSSCSSLWTCTDWSNCRNGVQTRICQDRNSCEVKISQPIVSRSCVCVENWVCDEWSSCQEGNKKRDCYDKNNCGSFEYLPKIVDICINNNELGQFNSQNSTFLNNNSINQGSSLDNNLKSFSILNLLKYLFYFIIIVGIGFLFFLHKKVSQIKY